MNYRTLFLEYLSNYNEYNYDFIQLVLLHKQDKDDIFKFVNCSDSVEIYHSRLALVYYKDVSFSYLNNSIIDLIFKTNKPMIYESSELVGLSDLYNKKPIMSKYVGVYPIDDNGDLIGAFFIYSNYATMWQIDNSKVFNLINNLQSSQEASKVNEISEAISSKIFSLEKDKKFYLSKSLQDILSIEKITTNYDTKGKGLKEEQNIKYQDCNLISYKEVHTSPILSIHELGKLKLAKFSLLYFKTNDQSFKKLQKTINNLDTSLGNYYFYQINPSDYCIIYDSVININTINNKFDGFSYIVVRSNHEIMKKCIFLDLVNYLSLSPVEEFNEKLYDYYLEKMMDEKVKQVKNNLSSSKIKISPIIISSSANIGGYYINDLINPDHLSHENKQKSLKALFACAIDYKDVDCVIELPESYLENGGKYSIAVNNLIKDYLNVTDKIYFITKKTEFSDKLINHLPSIEKHLIYKSTGNTISDLAFMASAKGLCLEGSEFIKSLKLDTVNMNNYFNYLLTLTNLLLVKIPQNALTLIHNEKILLICE